ncbi:MAG: CmcI family methyltransferase [Gemmataceae bacterium]
MSSPVKSSRWRPALSILALVALSAAGGFAVSRLSYFHDHQQTRVAAQYQTVEYINPWADVKVMQYPNDLVVYQQLIVDQEPDFIIETGTNYGGLSLFLSSILEWVKPEAKVLTVDIAGDYYRETLANRPKNPNIGKLFNRIEFFEGSSTAPEMIARLKERVGPGKKVLVLLDSLHTRDHVLAEMKLYGELVSPGGYLVVTDTHIDSTDRMVGPLTPFNPWRAEGPLEAIKAFLPDHPEFTQDRGLERYMISANRSGWLRKKG